MAQHEITVKVDEDIIEKARDLGVDDLSTVANEVFREHVERLAHRAGLRALLDEWEEKYGPPSEEARAEARAAFDELDGITDGRGAA